MINNALGVLCLLTCQLGILPSPLVSCWASWIRPTTFLKASLVRKYVSAASSFAFIFASSRQSLGLIPASLILCA